MVSTGPGYFPGYHHPSDVPAGVDWPCVAACARLAAGTIAAAAERLRGPVGDGP
jgi:methyl coenzyme M reductase beta subunit